MKKGLSLIFLMAMLFCFTSVASATPCSGLECGSETIYYSVTNSDNFWFNADNLTHTWDFDISPPLATGDVVVDSMLTVHFYEDFDPFSLERADVNTEDGDFWSGLIFFGLDQVGEVTAELEDYLLSVTVNNLEVDGPFRDYYGDFGVSGMDLEVCYTPAPVPEPGTLLLLGSGLAGLVLYRRRKASK